MQITVSNLSKMEEKKKSEKVRCMRALEAAQNPEEMAKEQRAVS